MMEFKVGELYSRNEVHEKIGGGEPRTYLPQIKGENRIAAGLFGRERNPEAPREIQVGKGPQNKKKAELLAKQGDKAIPVFVKRPDLKNTDKVWEHYGVYKFKELLNDKDTLSKAEEKSGRHGQLIYVLRLEPVSE
jgi:hypothetical protein